MELVAPNLYLLESFPKYMMNVYLMGDVLLDAGIRLSARRILRQIEGRPLSAHALTHPHPDHQGASKIVCERFGIPSWCGEGDADAMESGDFTATLSPAWNTFLQSQFWVGAGYPVSRRLREGDDVSGFTVIDSPGHTPGHISYWRESDRVLIIGDVLNALSLRAAEFGIRESPGIFTVDRALNIRSARKLAALDPKLICFGHGRPVHDVRLFHRFVENLPVD